jgi:heat shock protein HslJ
VIYKNSYKSIIYGINRAADTPNERRAALWLMGCLPLLLTGCANLIPPCPGRSTPPYTDLIGTVWELNHWNMPPNAMGEVRLRSMPNDSGQKIQIQFDKNRMSGFGGCNRFTAQIIDDGRNFQITQIASTRMACSALRDEIDRDFVYLLQDYRSIVRDGNYLLIIGPNREVLSFNLIKRNTP